MLFLARNDSPNIFFGISFAQRIEADESLLGFPFDRSILAPLDFIAHFFQLTQKGIKVSGRFFQNSVNILANLVSVGGALLIDRSLSPLGIGHLFDDGQPMFQTDQVAQSLNGQSGIVEVFEFVGAVQRGGVEDDMFALIKLPFKLLSLPLMVAFAGLSLLAKLCSNLSGYILSPLIFFVFGCGVYTVISQQWNQVLLLGIIELLFISALFGSVLMETVFDWFYSILKGFVQS